MFFFGPELFMDSRRALDPLACLQLREAKESLHVEWEFFFVALDTEENQHFQVLLNQYGFQFNSLLCYPPLPDKLLYLEARKLLRLCRACYSPMLEKAYRLNEVSPKTGYRNCLGKLPAETVRSAWLASHDFPVPFLFEQTLIPLL